MGRGGRFCWRCPDARVLLRNLISSEVLAVKKKRWFRWKYCRMGFVIYRWEIIKLKNSNILTR